MMQTSSTGNDVSVTKTDKVVGLASGIWVYCQLHAMQLIKYFNLQSS